MPKRLLLATDTWPPENNDVAKTLANTVNHLIKNKIQVHLVTPHEFPHGFQLPIYDSVRLALPSYRRIKNEFRKFNPDCVHIATEGPIGIFTRNFCLRNNLKFTTSYTTKFPEYGKKLWWIPEVFTYNYLRWFHKPSSTIMVPSLSVKRLLLLHGFQNKIAIWSRGVDTSVFYPRERKNQFTYYLYVGRISKEKNLIELINRTSDGAITIVGDGPYLNEIKKYALRFRYKIIIFESPKTDEELAEIYSNASAFIQPSKLETISLPMLEALACGTMVITYNTYKDILPDIRSIAVMSDILNDYYATKKIYRSNKQDCVNFVKNYYSLEKCTKQFYKNLVEI